jgi:GT2 family glycosyltransferase
MADRMVMVVLSYNGLADTRKCLHSLWPAMRPEAVALLVDNGSTDGTAAAVASEFPWCQILRVQENRGPAAGNNAGLREALRLGADWVLLLNNDTTVHPALVERMREAAAAHPEYSIIGPVIKFMDDPDIVMTDGTLFNLPKARGFFVRKPVPVNASVPPAITSVDIVNGCCLMISAETVREVGLFDETLFMYHDEADLCLRVRGSGRKLGVIDHALIWHKGSATSAATGKRSVRYFDARNLLHVLRKHHGAPEHGRGRLQTTAAYFRYMYYWFCAEREAGREEAAAAVLQGIADGLAGRRGPYGPKSRLLAVPFRLLFELARRRPGSWSLRKAGAGSAPTD